MFIQRLFFWAAFCCLSLSLAAPGFAASSRPAEAARVIAVTPESVQFYQEFPLSVGRTLLRGGIYRYREEDRAQRLARRGAGRRVFLHGVGGGYERVEQGLVAEFGVSEALDAGQGGGELIAGAAVQVAFNFGNAIGSIVGGAMLTTFSMNYRYTGLGGMPLALLAVGLLAFYSWRCETDTDAIHRMRETKVD